VRGCQDHQAREHVRELDEFSYDCSCCCDVATGECDVDLAGSSRARVSLFQPASASARPIEAAAPAVSPRANRRRAVPGCGGAAFSLGEGLRSAFEITHAEADLTDLGQGETDVDELERLHTSAHATGSLLALGPRA